MRINIKEKKETDRGWDFIVEIEDNDNSDSLEYKVELLSSDWLRLTRGDSLPEELIVRSFEFLLAREPKEAILRSFNLMEIADYFPDFEHEIKN